MEKIQTVLVTGANGMLASNVIEVLLSQGYKVRGTVRRKSSYRGPQSPSLELVECDFKDSQAMSPVMTGCDAVIHCAAMTSQSERDYSKFREVNVVATENLVKTAISLGVGTFVDVSTANTIGFGKTERAPMVYPFTKSNYALSKSESEKTIMKYKDDIRLVITNPTFMAGRYGTAKGANRLFNMVRKSPVVFCPPGGKSVLDVAEAAKGMVLAMQYGRSGENYLITGENLSYKQLFKRAAADLGRKPLFVPIPGWITVVAGKLGDFLAAIGIVTDMSSPTLAMLRINNFYYTDKAAKELGFLPAPLDFKKMLEG